jgi:hypothetical protein
MNYLDKIDAACSYLSYTSVAENNQLVEHHFQQLMKRERGKIESVCDDT